MIVCHCTGVTDRDIRAAVAWMRAADADSIITPGRIYHALGHRADCGGCMKLFVSTMRNAEGFAVQDQTGDVPAILRSLRAGCGNDMQRTAHEGRQEGHRISERGAAV